MTMNDHPMLRPVYLLDFAVYKPPEEFKMRDQDAVQDSALYRNPGWAEVCLTLTFAAVPCYYCYFK